MNQIVNKTPNVSVAAALRSIGQDISSLFPLNIEIDFSDGVYQVRGKALSDIARGSADEENHHVMQRAWDFLVRGKAKIDMLQWHVNSDSFERSYEQCRLDEIDEQFNGRRADTDRLPDIYSLAERLRIIGRVIDSTGGRLISLTKNLDSVNFKYADCEGDIRTGEYSAIELYQLQQEFYTGRRPMPLSLDAYKQRLCASVAA